LPIGADAALHCWPSSASTHALAPLVACLIVVVTGGLARMQWAFYKKHL
jgi:hypothetical protein